MANREQRNTLIKHMYELRGSELRRCLWYVLENGRPSFCGNPAIRAHSVQNGWTLELLSEGGHVVAPELRIDVERGPQYDLKEVGRNRATTFAGLCSQHDDALFSPIEKSPIDFSNPEHRFLLAYRATFYELHATMAAGSATQLAYQKRIEVGVDPSNTLTPTGLFATHRLMVAYETWMYKAVYDEAYLDRNFSAINHELIELEVARPTLAASGLFSIGSDRRDLLIGVCITVLPRSPTTTSVLVSYLPQHRRRVRHALYSMLRTNGETQKIEISRRLLNECENFVLSPSFVRSWSPERRARILDLFVKTVFKNDLTISHADLNLFA